MNIAAMPAITYREHLDLFNKYKVTHITYTKIFPAMALALMLSLSISLHLVNNSNRQVIPVNEQALYFQSASSSFYKSKQALDELRTSLQIAGAKTQKVDSLKEASASSRVPGFFMTLGDIQKTIDHIKLVRDNIENEHKNLQGSTPPVLYETLDSQIYEYMLQSENFLAKIEEDQFALKDIISAATPAFFLPALSDEEIWERGDIGEIKVYYQRRKDEAQQAHSLFKSTETLPHLQAYKDLQISHFLLVVNVAENIISTLERPVRDSEDDKLQLKEEAYQVLIGAQRENALLSQQLAQRRIELSSLSNYADELASLANRERVIESGLVQGNEAQQISQANFDKNPSIFSSFNFTGFTK